MAGPSFNLRGSRLYSVLLFGALFCLVFACLFSRSGGAIRTVRRTTYYGSYYYGYYYRYNRSSIAGGGLAGVVIGCLIGAAIVTAAIYICIRMCCPEKLPRSCRPHHMRVQPRPVPRQGVVIKPHQAGRPAMQPGAAPPYNIASQPPPPYPGPPQAGGAAYPGHPQAGGAPYPGPQQAGGAAYPGPQQAGGVYPRAGNGSVVQYPQPGSTGAAQQPTGQQLYGGTGAPAAPIPAPYAVQPAGEPPRY